MAISATASQSSSDCERAPSDRWGLMADFTGGYFAQRDERITQYVRFCWMPENDTIEIDGRDNGGRIIAGQIFLIEPGRAGRGTVVRMGSDFVFVVALDQNKAILIGTEAGVTVKQIYRRLGPSQYAIDYEEQRGRAWVTLRQFAFEKMTQRMIEALGFPQPTSEELRLADEERRAALARTAGFGKRFVDAMTEAVIKGAAQGTSDGLARRVEHAIAPKPPKPK